MKFNTTFVKKPSAVRFFKLQLAQPLGSVHVDSISAACSFVDASLAPRYVFLVFCIVAESKAQTLFRSIKDMFTRLNLPLPNVQGYRFYRLSNISGQLNGIRSFIF